jgi:archaeal flagellin FlaB
MSNRFLKDEKGFTGLEAAIVLIAFVVVAAVFSYVMLGAGFFTTQKSQEVVHTGVTQASSSIAPAGDVIVKGADSATDETDYTSGSAKADEITLYVTNTAGGTPVDLDKTIITYTDDENFVTVPHVDTIATIGTAGAVAAASIPNTVILWADTTGWVYSGIIVNDGSTDGDNLLSSGEKYKVVINIPEVLSFAAGETPGTIDATGELLPQANEKFTIQIKPPEGAVLSITKTLPAALVENQYYPVY